ncbi:MAG: chromosome segregation protein SMC [Candidatus Brocadiia bacterium]
MKLKKLELYGFKSFAERTVFEFEDSLSALVGPNGSGKSNVADAIKWVLGERSAKQLRGDEMASVIFSGSENRKALNFADVKLTIDNSGGWLPVDYDEVCIGRRVDRSGQSDYYINGQQCRLKDIRRMLLDTGMGSSSYSFIEQGQIDQILRSSASERRAIFEEAAGINRFLEQKREAERKLDRVSVNLERVGDIVEEVQHQLRSVKYQAGRARTFKRQTERLQRLRLAYSLHQCRELEDAAERTGNRIQEATEQKQQLQRRAEAARRELQEARDELEAARNGLSDCRHRLTRVEARLEGIEREGSLNERRRQELTQQMQELAARRRDLEERRRSAEEELTEAEAELTGSAASVQQCSEDLKRQKQRLSDLRSELRDRQERLGERKSRAFDLFEEETRLGNQVDVLAAERRTLRGRLERIENRKQELHSQLEGAESERSETHATLEELDARQAETEEQRAEVQRRLAQVEYRLEELTAHQAQTREELSGRSARRDVLRDLEERAEGVRTGAARLLEAEPEGMVGMVARLIEVPLELAPAVDVVLGELAQAAVFRTAESARHALPVLTGEDGGRASLLILDDLCPPPAGGLEDAEGVRGRLSEMTAWREGAAAAVEFLLGNAFLVEDAEAARRLACAGLPPHVKLVTPEGECYGANGLWSAGAPETPSLISRRSELAGLKGEILALEQKLENLAGRRKGLARELRELADERDGLAAREENLRRRGADLRSHLEVADQRARQLRHDLEMAQAEEGGVSTELAEVDEREGELRDQSRRAAQRRAEAEAEVEELEERIAGLQAEEQELSEQVGSTEAELARARERHDGLRNLLDRLRVDRGRHDEQLKALDAEWEACERRVGEAKQAAAAAREERESLQAEKAELGERLEEQSGAVSALQERIRSLTEGTQALEEEKEKLEGTLHELRLEQNSTRVKLEDLIERTAEDYGVRLRRLEMEPETWREQSPFLTRRIREWQSEQHETAPTDEVAAWYREAEEDREEDDMEMVGLEEAVALREDVLALADEPETDWDQVHQEIATLKAKVDRIGNVNVAAIRQQEELETRLQFLTDQKEDLERARRHEREIIRELKKKSRRRFSETFEEVRDNFQALFRKLFGGGNADLLLEEEAEDILEAGIEIIARPPGKETNTISLLSGGEKALTTVALLFALFQAKPSPFCLLDEVDAPLDDSNVERFLMLLEEFRRDTQFIIITHNKLTMGVAQVLYGVTMAEGVTRKISVRFEDVDRHLEGGERPRAKAG